MDNTKTLIKALEEKEQFYYKSSKLCDNRSDALKYNWTVAEIAKGNIVADCIQLIKDHTEGHVLVPIEPTSEMQTAGAMGVKGDTTIINKLWIANKVYRAMITAYKGESDE